LLRSSCSYFRPLFYGKLKTEAVDEDGRTLIHIAHTSRPVFLVILRYLYTGVLIHSFNLLRSHCPPLSVFAGCSGTFNVKASMLCSLVAASSLLCVSDVPAMLGPFIDLEQTTEYFTKNHR
jgi:hypothetical protein